VLCNLVNVLVVQSKFDGVEELLQEAQSLCTGKPGITPDTKRWLWTNFAEFYLATDRPAKAAEANLSRRAYSGGEAKHLYETAAELARCVARLSEGTADQGKYADLAMETLRQAVAKGFRDGPRLRDDRRFDALRQRPDFVRLAAEVPVGGPN
jgi:hypothetical protein